MEEAHSVNSPRRVLSFSKRRKQKTSLQGPKPSEVYGFVGSISTVVATLILLIWAYVPDKLVESIGIHYYPSRYWVLAMPTYLMVSLLLALAFYLGLNFIATPPPTCLNTLFDEYSREPGMEEGEDRPIDPISDIDITRINDLMFNSSDTIFIIEEFDSKWVLMGTISSLNPMVEVDGVKMEEAYFRGRKLQGATIPLPSGYSGYVLGQASNLNANGKRKASDTQENSC